MVLQRYAKCPVCKKKTLLKVPEGVLKKADRFPFMIRVKHNDHHFYINIVVRGKIICVLNNIGARLINCDGNFIDIIIPKAVLARQIGNELTHIMKPVCPARNDNTICLLAAHLCFLHRNYFTLTNFIAASSSVFTIS